MKHVARIAALYRYPVKSARGQQLERATIEATGLAHDREWMIVDDRAVFVTQREQPRLALLGVTLHESGGVTTGLTLEAPDAPTLHLTTADFTEPRTVRVWRDEVHALDAGDAAAGWISAWLGAAFRLVRFAPGNQRLSSMEWTGGVAAPNQFSDGYPILVLSRASIADLSRRVGTELRVNRFRPNLLLDGLQAYDEDRIQELKCGDIRLRLVKPCARCAITTTDQQRGERSGDEPLRTLRGYRHDRALQGVLFGQNAIVIAGAGAGARLQVGVEMEVTWRAGAEASNGPASSSAGIGR